MNARQDIARSAIWAGELTEDELDRARRGLTERHFSKGAYICHRGDRLDHWTGVVAGLVKISAISRDGKAMTFAGATDGGWVGEGSMLKDEPRRYDLVVLRDTRLAMMTRSTFMWLYENSRGFNRYLVRALNERMGQFIATIEYDRILAPKARVARNLSWFFNRVLYQADVNAIRLRSFVRFPFFRSTAMEQRLMFGRTAKGEPAPLTILPTARYMQHAA